MFPGARFAQSFFVVAPHGAVPIGTRLVLKRNRGRISFAERTRLDGGRVFGGRSLAGHSKVVSHEFPVGVNAVPGIRGRFLVRHEVGNGVV